MFLQLQYLFSLGTKKAEQQHNRCYIDAGIGLNFFLLNGGSKSVISNKKAAFLKLQICAKFLSLQ